MAKKNAPKKPPIKLAPSLKIQCRFCGRFARNIGRRDTCGFCIRNRAAARLKRDEKAKRLARNQRMLVLPGMPEPSFANSLDAAIAGTKNQRTALLKRNGATTVPREPPDAKPKRRINLNDEF